MNATLLAAHIANIVPAMAQDSRENNERLIFGLLNQDQTDQMKKPFNQDMFDYFADNHNLTLLESEMHDICYIVNELLTQSNQRLAVCLSHQTRRADKYKKELSFANVALMRKNKGIRMMAAAQRASLIERNKLREKITQ